MAYNKSYLTKGDSVDSFLKTMKSLSPQQREEKWQSLALTPMQHDVHFDLEDSNSKFMAVSSVQGCIKLIVCLVLVGRDPDNGNVIFKVSTNLTQSCRWYQLTRISFMTSRIITATTWRTRGNTGT